MSRRQWRYGNEKNDPKVKKKSILKLPKKGQKCRIREKLRFVTKKKEDVFHRKTENKIQ